MDLVLQSGNKKFAVKPHKNFFFFLYGDYINSVKRNKIYSAFTTITITTKVDRNRNNEARSNLSYDMRKAVINSVEIWVVVNDLGVGATGKNEDSGGGTFGRYGGSKWYM